MITVFIDGSCYVKTMLGGSAAYIIYEDGTEQFFSKGYEKTTISRMEMRAILEAMKIIKDKTKDVTFYSDSEFIVNSLTKGWLETWERQNFVMTKNRDIWEYIIKEKKKFKGKLIFNHLRGHQKI
jgi:ribonuclease HI